MEHHGLAAWHRFAASGDAAILDDLLADDVVFHSPVVHTPQCGKAITKRYLMAAVHVLGNGQFRYTREVVTPGDVVLEFVTEIDGIMINGVDMMRFEDGHIVEFKVMVRPLKAIQMVHAKMGEMLQRFETGASR
jgi:ketosteroid isomerase-like protein